MKYKSGKFFIENISAAKIAKKFGTPLYCYSKGFLNKNIDIFKKNFKSIKPLICFSIKANNNLEILKILKKNNLGADVVSKGELMTSLKAGISPNKIVFSGVGKTSEEISFAIDKNIFLINAESENEIKLIENISKNKKKCTNVGIRFNPNVDALTNSKISTGRNVDKFGVDSKILTKIVNQYKYSKYLDIKCLSVHIGSQITNYKPYTKMINQVDRLLKKVKFKFDYIDFGGGMGIQYKKNSQKLNYKKYNRSINIFLKKNKVKIIFEPGRSIIGNTGVLLTKVIYIKESKNRKFVILDAAMNDLIRPALYNAYHNIIPIQKNKKIIKKIHNFVGPVCETSDQFLTVGSYNKLKENDILAICDVGAYGSVLSSNYNLRTRPSEVIVDKSKIKLAKKRQSILDII